jgi:hypothetical protein
MAEGPGAQTRWLVVACQVGEREKVGRSNCSMQLLSARVRKCGFATQRSPHEFCSRLRFAARWGSNKLSLVDELELVVQIRDPRIQSDPVSLCHYEIVVGRALADVD